MENASVVPVTLLNDANSEDRKLLVFVEPRICRNLRLERHDTAILCVADVWTTGIYLLKDGIMYKLPAQNHLANPAFGTSLRSCFSDLIVTTEEPLLVRDSGIFYDSQAV